MKIKPEEIIDGIYLIGGTNITSYDDAAIYLIDFTDDLVMIDAGAGRSSAQIIHNIEMLGFNPTNISNLILITAILIILVPRPSLMNATAQKYYFMNWMQRPWKLVIL
jgi:hypothetical protein